MTTTRWLSAAGICAATGLSKYQLRQMVLDQRLQAGKDFLPGPRPNSPRRFKLEAIWPLLGGQLPRDDGRVFPPPRTALEGIEIDADADQIRLHDGSGQAPAVVQLGGLNGLLALIDTLVEIQRQGRRAAGQGRPLTEAHAACPGLQLSAGITTHGLVSLAVGSQAIEIPLAEVLDLQAALTRRAADTLRDAAKQRAALDQLLAASPANPAEVSHG
jgi:hypothetical protein